MISSAPRGNGWIWRMQKMMERKKKKVEEVVNVVHSSGPHWCAVKLFEREGQE